MVRMRPSHILFLFLTTLLISGLYGFDVRGFDALPSLQIHYWSEVLRVLRREIGADVVVTRVPPYEYPSLKILAASLILIPKGLAPWLSAPEDSTNI